MPELSLEEAFGLKPGPSSSPAASPSGEISLEEAFGQPQPQPQPQQPGAAPSPAPVQAPETDKAMGQWAALGAVAAPALALPAAITAGWMYPRQARAAISGFAQQAIGLAKPFTRGAVTFLRGEEVEPVTTEPYGVTSTMPLTPPPRMTAVQAMAEHNRILQHPALAWTQKAPEFAREAFPIPKGEERKWYTQAGEMLGGFAPLLAAGPAAPLAIGAVTTGEIVEHTYAEKIKQGIEPERAARETFDKALAGGTAAATVWAVLPKPLKTVFDKYIVDRLGWEGAKRFFLNRAAQAAEGAALGVTTQPAINIATGEPVMKDVGATTAALAVTQAVFPRARTAREVKVARETYETEAKRTREAVEEFLGRRKPPEEAERAVPPPETVVSETAKVPGRKEYVTEVTEKEAAEQPIKPPEKKVAEEPTKPVEEPTAAAEPVTPLTPAQYKHLNRKANAGYELTEGERQQVLAYEAKPPEAPAAEKPPITKEELREAVTEAETPVARPLEPVTASQQRAIDSWRESRDAGEITQAQFDDAVAKIQRGEMPAKPGERLEKPGEAELPIIEAEKLESKSNEARIAELEKTEADLTQQRRDALAKNQLLSPDKDRQLRDVQQELEARRASRGIPETEPRREPAEADTPEVTQAKAEVAAWRNANPAAAAQGYTPDRLKKALQHAQGEAEKVRLSKQINRETIEKLLPPEDLQAHADLKSQWSRLNFTFKRAIANGDRNAAIELAKKQAALRHRMQEIENKLPGGGIYDVVGIGAGPTNTIASIYSGAERLKMIALDISTEPGASSKTPIYENVSGVLGQTGRERAMIGRLAAERHGARFEKIVGLDGPPKYDPKTRLWTIKTKGAGKGGAGGKTFLTRTWIGATGTRAKGAPFPILDAAGKPLTRGEFDRTADRSLPVTGSTKDTSGIKIYLSDGISAALDAKGGTTVAIGGANSAGQGVIDMALIAMDKSRRPGEPWSIRARTAADPGQPVHIIYRGKDLSMSGYLQDDIQELIRLGWVIKHPNAEVHHVEMRDGKKIIVLKRSQSRAEVKAKKPEEIIGEIPADGIASFTGGEPVTGWLPKEFKRDAKGFIETSADLRPLVNIPGHGDLPIDNGAYIAGSMRSEAINRMAPSEGEGAQAIAHVGDLITAREKASLTPGGKPWLPKWKEQLRAGYNRDEYVRKLRGEEPEQPSFAEGPAVEPVAERPTAQELYARQTKAFDVFSELKKTRKPDDPDVKAAWEEYKQRRREFEAEAGEATVTAAPPGAKVAPSRLIPPLPKPKPVVPGRKVAEKIPQHLGAAVAQQQQTETPPTPKGRVPRESAYPPSPFAPRRGKVYEPGTPEEMKAAFDVVDKTTLQPARAEMYAPEGQPNPFAKFVDEGFQQRAEARAQARPPATPGMIAEPRPTAPSVREQLAKTPERLPTETLRDEIGRARETLERFRTISKGASEKGLVKELSTKIDDWQRIVDTREQALRDDPVRAEAEATRRVEANVHYPDKLVTDLASGKKGSVDAADEIVMTRDRERLQQQRDQAAKVAEDTTLSKERRSEAGSNFEDLDAQIRARDEVTDGGNLFQGRKARMDWHNFRQRDYNLPTMEQKLRVAKGGKPVTKEETADLKQKVDKLNDAMVDVEKAKVRTGWRPGLGEKVAPGLRHKQFVAHKAKEALDDTIFKEMMRHKNTAKRAFQLYRDVAGVSRGLMTIDMTSALLRQGGLLFFGNPIRSLRLMRDVVRAARSEERYFKLMQDIRERPNAEMYVRSGLGLTEIKSPKMQDLEEQYMGQWTSKIPILNNSQRAYVYFLNRLRADTFDTMAANLGRNHNVTLEQAKALSNFINVFTGRGYIKPQAAGAITLMNEAFFAPRYVISRFQALTGQPLRYAKDPAVRKLIAYEYAKTLLGYGVFYGLVATGLKQLGATVEFNPLSSDFGKVRIGDTRWDPLSGVAQATVFLTRVILARTKGPRGRIEKLGGKHMRYSQRNYGSMIQDFVRSKLAPMPAAFWNVQQGKKVTGEETGLLPGYREGHWTTGELLGLVIPMNGMDVYRTMVEGGVSKGIIAFLLANFGQSVNTYSTRVRPRQRKRHRSRPQ